MGDAIISRRGGGKYNVNSVIEDGKFSFTSENIDLIPGLRLSLGSRYYIDSIFNIYVTYMLGTNACVEKFDHNGNQVFHIDFGQSGGFNTIVALGVVESTGTIIISIGRTPGTIMAIKEDGTTIWEKETGASNHILTTSNPYIYSSFLHGTSIAHINPVTGSTYKYSDSIFSSPGACKGLYYIFPYIFAFEDNYIYKIHQADMTYISKHNPKTSGIAVDNELNVYTINDAGVLFKYNSAFKEVWRVNITKYLKGCKVITTSTGIYVSGDIMDANNSLVCSNIYKFTQDGDFVWMLPKSGSIDQIAEYEDNCLLLNCRGKFKSGVKIIA